MKKNIEKTVFIALNFFLSCGLLIFNSILSLTYYLNPKKEFVFDVYRDDDLWWSLGIGLILLVAVWIMKLSIFSILYKFPKALPYVNDVLKKFATDDEYRYDIFFNIILTDIAVLLVSTIVFKILIYRGFSDFGDFIGTLFAYFILTLLTGGGVSTSYLSFLNWFKRKKST